MNKIMIEMLGGVLQSVVSMEDIEIIIIDHDDDQEDKVNKAKQILHPDSICENDEQFDALLKEALTDTEYSGEKDVI